MGVRVRVRVDPSLLGTRALQAGLANVWVLVDTAVDTTFSALAAVVRQSGPQGRASSHPSVNSRRPTQHSGLTTACGDAGGGGMCAGRQAQVAALPGALGCCGW
jgi:hypothetical protein